MLIFYTVIHFFTLITVSIIHYDQIFLFGFALGLIKISDSLLIDISLLEVHISPKFWLFIFYCCPLFYLFKARVPSVCFM